MTICSAGPTPIDGAGNFGWRDEPFEKSDAANEEMNMLFDSLHERHLAEPNTGPVGHAQCRRPDRKTQIYSNIKIAIGGGINELRDAEHDPFGLLTNRPASPGEAGRFGNAFEEGIRWVARSRSRPGW